MPKKGGAFGKGGKAKGPVKVKGIHTPFAKAIYKGKR
jgi:hypothetical protein